MSGETEDEILFVLKCAFFEHSGRKKYIKEYYRKKPSTFKLLDLLNSTNTNEMLNLPNYGIFEKCLFERTTHTRPLTAT